MTSGIALDRVPAMQRMQRWREAVCDTFVRLECDAPGSVLSHGSIHAAVSGDLHVAQVQSGPQRVRRTAHWVERADQAFVLASIQLRGKTVVQQDGREAVLTPGCLAFYDTNRPYTLGLPLDFDQVVLQVPHAVLQRSSNPWVTALRLGPSNPYAQALVALVPRLMLLDAAPESPQSRRTAQVAVSLMQLALECESPAVAQVDPLPTSAASRALWGRACDLMQQRLDLPNLTGEWLAGELRVSVRRLQEAFQSQGSTISECLWALRLDQARALLAAPQHQATSVTSIALSCGFTDAAHFSRRFRQRFGMTPRQARLG